MEYLELEGIRPTGLIGRLTAGTQGYVALGALSSQPKHASTSRAAASESRRPAIRPARMAFGLAFGFLDFLPEGMGVVRWATGGGKTYPIAWANWTTKL